MENTSTDFLIVGAGPAGASLACFLAEYGLTGIMIAAAPSTADTPRAHITNMAALECLRDIGLEQECLHHATTSGNMEHTRWCHDMAGEEYARIHSWGHDPQRYGDYEAASPCNHVDLPQTLLEPVLINRAKEKGWDIRFSTSFVTFEQKSPDKIESQVTDLNSDKGYTITSKYLFGCDGARSQVMRQLDIPLIRKPGGGLAFNVYIEADLTHLVKTRNGNLHWIIQPEREPLPYSWLGLARMVKPWTRWMFIIFPKPDYDPNSTENPTQADWEAEIRRLIGDDSIPFEIINVSRWAVNEVVAEYYSVDNIFCLGDAVHRHPPFNGLGSNTCIQDSYNLAWKLSLVQKHHASPTLLKTYSIERQPVGLGVITRANQGFRDHLHVWNAMGITEATVSCRMACFNELRSPTATGRARRAALRNAIEGTAHEFHALGQEMNQRYASSAIYTSDEPSAAPPLPPNPVLAHQISTYPGARLPHAWLNTRVPGHRLSTHDLAGHGQFSLFTGPGGEGWRDVVKKLREEIGVGIRVVSIGWCMDYEDMYFDWARRREVEEDGCVVVRPDRFVCWREMSWEGEESGMKLRRALRSILGLEGVDER